MKLEELHRTDGIRTMMFECPGCEMSHMVNVSGSGVPVWGWNGSMTDPTLTPSIKVTYRHPKGYTSENPAPVGYQGECVDEICHSFVTNGRIQFLGDCTHKLAGQTVDLPEIDQ